MSQCQRGTCHTSEELFVRKNRLLSTNRHMLFLTVLFDSWAHFHKHTDPLNKMNIITNQKRADKVKQSNNVWQNYIINANLSDMLPFFPL